MNIDEYQKLMEQARKNRRKTPKPNKYHAKQVGGHASRKEHDRSNLLHLLERQGKISCLREQVRFVLIPAQYADGKCVERACSYVADFVYLDQEGNQVVEDTKGVRTKEYVIKRKLMLHVHGIAIKEI